MKIYIDVEECLTSESYVTMTLLHFSSAIDTVDHNVLIRRLKTEHGVEGSDKVKVNDTLSDAQFFVFWAPQGWILGPILYSLYVK